MTPIDSDGSDAAARLGPRHGLAVGEGVSFGAILASLPEGVVFLNHRGELEVVYPAVSGLHGDGSESRAALVQGLDIRHIRTNGAPFPTEEQPAAVARRTGRPVRNVEVGTALADGPIRWHLVTAEPVWDGEDGEPRAVVFFLDVTERRQAEAALREREAQLEAIANGTTDAVFLKDTQGRYVLANTSTLRFLGLPAEHVLGRDDTAVFPPDEARKLMALDREVMHSGRVQTNEEVITVQGGPRTFLATKGPVHDADGQLVGLFGISRDISERKLAEQVLRDSEARLRYELQLSQALSAPFELDAVLQMVVDGATQLLDLDTGAVYLQDGDQVVLAATSPPLPPNFPDELRRAALSDHPHLRAAIAEGTAITLPDAATAQLTPAERSACDVRGLRSLVYIPLLAADRAVGALILGATRGVRTFQDEELLLSTGFAGQAAQTIENVRLFEASQEHAAALAREVAERTRAEQALAAEAENVRELLGQAERARSSLVEVLEDEQRALSALRDSEERFRVLFEQAGDYAFVLEPHEQLGPVIVDANEAACLAHGYTRDELIGQSVLAIDVSGVSDQVARTRLEQVLAGETMRMRTVHRRRDGSTFPVEVTAKVVRRGGRSPLIFSTERDISERVRLEEERERLQAELAQAQKMESIGRLAGGIAHDFNNVLGAIQGYTELALQDVRSEEALRADLGEVLKACDRSADLTRQLLAFARRQTILPRVQNLNETIASMLAMLRRLIGENVELLWRPGRDLWSVRVDSSQMDQILANLCVNARDAISDVGTVTIETGNADLDETCGLTQVGCPPGEYVRLSVTDSGCGMSEETRLHIFEPFYTTKPLGEGTGLGLATVYGAVRQNGGFIRVVSEPGQGSTFDLYLPRCTSAVDDQVVSARATGTAGAGQTIVVVEDDPGILTMVKRQLSSRGYQILAAGTAKEAMRLVAEHDGQIELLLTDVIMPEMNGRDLANALTAARPDLKCLFMSGYPADVVAQHGVVAEGTSFIGKPFAASALLDQVGALLKG
ncbi:MAG: PAS domain S-box protein [Armatimonadetes bacterium]|nr:PAS domain S-box protein [Armatimonadota bacterium]